jgi:hypothetical protein
MAGIENIWGEMQLEYTAGLCTAALHSSLMLLHSFNISIFVLRILLSDYNMN